MTDKRSTLRIFKDSPFSRRFDTAIWHEQHADVPTIKKWSYEQVVNWAKSHDDISNEVADLLKENEINGVELLALGRDDLKELGIKRPGTLAVVTKAIKDLQMKSQDRPIFIDHDPYCFSKILDQLRLKAMLKEKYEPLSFSDINETKKDLFAETIDYFFPGDLTKLIWKKLKLDTNILSGHQTDIINRWLEEDSCGFDTTLLYRASRDGWEASDFHEKCNNQGPTLTVIQSTEGYIFGGFCDISWSNEE
eukprot:1986-Ditylum_brightwellii.AAC.1